MSQGMVEFIYRKFSHMSAFLHLSGDGIQAIDWGNQSDELLFWSGG
jgi:hypothetical protein